MATRRYTDPNKWPRDHAAKHSAAAKKGWRTRTGGYTNPKTRAEYAQFRKRTVAAQKEAKDEARRRGQKAHERQQLIDKLEDEESKAAKVWQRTIEARRNWEHNHGVSPQRYISSEMGRFSDRTKIKKILKEEEQAESKVRRIRAQLQQVKRA